MLDAKLLIDVLDLTGNLAALECVHGAWRVNCSYWQPMRIKGDSWAKLPRIIVGHGACQELMSAFSSTPAAFIIRIPFPRSESLRKFSTPTLFN